MYGRFLLRVLAVVTLVSATGSQLVAQSAATGTQPGPRSISLTFGAGVPLGETIAKNSGLLGIGFSHRLAGDVEATFDLAALYDGRSHSGNKGEGSLVSSALLVHSGVRLWHSNSSMFAHYGGGVSFAHYRSQVDVHGALCSLCLSRDGWGAYGAAGAGTYLKSRRARARPWIAMDVTLDWLAVSGVFGTTNPSDRQTSDGWLTIRGAFGVRF